MQNARVLGANYANDNNMRLKDHKSMVNYWNAMTIFDGGLIISHLQRRDRVRYSIWINAWIYISSQEARNTTFHHIEYKNSIILFMFNIVKFEEIREIWDLLGALKSRT